MPTVYSRVASGATRGNLTEVDVTRASEVVLEKALSMRAAAKEHKIPERTIRGRIKKYDFLKTGEF
jgi:hypothetical protein